MIYGLQSHKSLNIWKVKNVWNWKLEMLPFHPWAFFKTFPLIRKRVAYPHFLKISFGSDEPQQIPETLIRVEVGTDI